MHLDVVSVLTPVGDFHMFVEPSEGIVRVSGFGGLDALRNRMPLGFHTF